jgi:hypothetical protein
MCIKKDNDWFSDQFKNNQTDINLEDKIQLKKRSYEESSLKEE